MSDNTEYFADDITMYLCYPTKIEKFKTQIQKMFDQTEIPDIDINIISFINFNTKNVNIFDQEKIQYNGFDEKKIQDNVFAYILNQYNTKKKCLKINDNQKR